MKSALVVASVAALLGAPAAARAALLAQFSASRTERCVAPCAVFFDATETRDPSTPHPFHQLVFAWEFGDERGESWRISGRPKNGAIGGIAGHLFERPGTFTVTLRVTNPAGASAVASRTVIVADPDAAFPGDATTCVSTSGNFEGCPAGARRLRSGEFAGALANAPGRRTLLRRSESFAWTQTVHLADASAKGSAIGVFGAGAARATLRAGVDVLLDPGNDWRVSHLALRGPGTGRPLAAITENAGVRHFTMQDVAITGFNGCTSLWSPEKANEQIAYVDVSCAEFPDPGTGTKFYEDTQESMFLGLDIDKGDHRDPRDQTEFAYRTVFSQKKLIQHGRFRGRAPNHSKNLLQLRHCPTVGPWRARCPDGALPSRYVLVSDNHFLEGGGPRAASVIRVCDHGSCSGAPGSSQRVEDYVFERNLFQLVVPDGSTEQLGAVFEIQAARTSVRDNVADLQGWPRGGPPRLWFAMVDAFSNPGRDATRDIWIHHNTLYFGAALGKSIVLCGVRGAAADLECSSNLVYAPDLGGQLTDSFGPGWSAAGNRLAAENPFPASPPARGKATLRDLAAFRSAGAAGARLAASAAPQKSR